MVVVWMDDSNAMLLGSFLLIRFTVFVESSYIHGFQIFLELMDNLHGRDFKHKY